MRAKQTILVAAAVAAQLTAEQRDQLSGLDAHIIVLDEIPEPPPTPIEHYAHVEKRRHWTHPKSPRDSYRSRRR